MGANHNPVLGTEDLKPALVAGFRFMTNYGAKMGPNEPYIHYKPPVLYNGAEKWYVYFYFRHPETGAWKRFKVYEDINRIKDLKDRQRYAELLVDAVYYGLKTGYNPFAPPKEEKRFKVWSLNQALNYYKQKLPDMDLRDKTKSCYLSMVTLVQNMEFKELLDPLEAMEADDLMELLDRIRVKHKWKNTTYNGYFGYFKTFLNWCVEKKLIKVNPLLGTKKKKTEAEKNKAFSNQEFTELMKHLETKDQNLYHFCRFVYFTGTRPKSETRLLRLRHIDFEKGQLEIPADISKNKKYDRVPLHKDLLAWLTPFRKLPKDYFIFTNEGRPGPKEAGHNYFSNYFRPIREELGLSALHTIYSLKHTRTIHLANAGVSSYDIQRMWRHSSLEMTEKYLRELGLNISRAAVDFNHDHNSQNTL